MRRAALLLPLLLPRLASAIDAWDGPSSFTVTCAAADDARPPDRLRLSGHAGVWAGVWIEETLDR